MRSQLRSDEASRDRQAVPDVSQGRHDLLGCDARKPMQKVMNAAALCKLCEKSPRGNTRACEDPGATHTLRRLFDGETILPLRHHTSVGPSAGNLESEQ